MRQEKIPPFYIIKAYSKQKLKAFITKPDLKKRIKDNKEKLLNRYKDYHIKILKKLYSASIQHLAMAFTFFIISMSFLWFIFDNLSYIGDSFYIAFVMWLIFFLISLCIVIDAYAKNFIQNRGLDLTYKLLKRKNVLTQRK